MSYIGAQPTTASFPYDQFSGNGSTTAFTLSYAPASTSAILVMVSGIVQNPTTYSVSGQILTFTGAPPTGTNNIEVLFLGIPSISGGGGGATVTSISDQANTSTGYLDIPSGTTAQRPSSPGPGYIRHNTTTGNPEWYSNILGAWVNFSASPAYELEYLVVGGGGGGGAQGGGGGAGGFRTASGVSIALNTAYTVTVGAGGAANTGGSASVFSTISSAGGGAGGRASGGSVNGGNGGSGGGASVSATQGTGGTGNTPTTVPAQGTNGGINTTASNYGGGGGGGATSAGGNGTTTLGGAGGAGTASSITGSAVTYAGGGGGGLFATPGTGGAGGAGGGGAGSVGNANATSGTSGTGGGGGGTGTTVGTVGTGGSGVVILKYSNNFMMSAGAGLTVTTTTVGAYSVSVFTAGTDTITFT